LVSSLNYCRLHLFHRSLLVRRKIGGTLSKNWQRLCSLTMASNCLTNHHRPNVRQMARPTTNGSSAWKEALKRSCLERARQKRRSAITRARLQILSDSELGTTFHDNNNTGGNHGPDNIMHQEDQGPDFEIDMEETAYKRKSQKRDFLGSATEVIEHELKASGVGVGTASPHFILSPEPSQIMAETETYKKSRTWSVAKEQKVRSSFSSEYSEDVRSLGTSMAAVDPLDNDGLNDESCNENLETISNQQKQNMEWHEKSGGDVDLFDDGYDSTEEEYVISEEEYYDLMREVEEELHREGKCIMLCNHIRTYKSYSTAVLLFLLFIFLELVFDLFYFAVGYF
jgi:hypothetical protein